MSEEHDWDKAFEELLRNELPAMPEDDIESIVIIQFPLATAQRVVEASEHIQDHACPMAMVEVADFLRTLVQLMKRTVDGDVGSILFQEMGDFGCPDDEAEETDE